MWNYLKGKKTYLLALAGIIYAVTGAMTGHSSWKEAVDIIWASGIASAIRNAIK